MIDFSKHEFSDKLILKNLLNQNETEDTMQFTIDKITNKTESNSDRELNNIPILGENDLKITSAIIYIMMNVKLFGY